MGYTTLLSEEELKKLFEYIPIDDLCLYLNQHSKDLFKAIGLGRNYVKEAKEDSVKFLKKNQKNKIIASYIEQYLVKQVNCITKKFECSKNEVSSQSEAYLKALIGSYFENNVALYFKLAKKDNGQVACMIEQLMKVYHSTGRLPENNSSKNDVENNIATIGDKSETCSSVNNKQPVSFSDSSSSEIKEVINIDTVSEIFDKTDQSVKTAKKDFEENAYIDSVGVSVPLEIKSEYETAGVKSVKSVDEDINLEDFTKFFEEYDKQSKIVEKGLKDNLKIISEGLPLVGDDIDYVNRQMLELKRIFDYIKLKAKAFPDLVNISEGASISELEVSVKKSIHKRKIAEIESKLNAFIAIQSRFEDYVNALKPYKDYARDLLIRLSSIEEIPEEVKLEVAKREAFIDAITMECLDNSNGEELLDKISGEYSIKVQRGIFFKKYYIPNDMQSLIKKKSLTLQNKKTEITADRETTDSFDSSDLLSENIGIKILEKNVKSIQDDTVVSPTNVNTEQISQEPSGFDSSEKVIDFEEKKCSTDMSELSDSTEITSFAEEKNVVINKVALAENTSIEKDEKQTALSDKSSLILTKERPIVNNPSALKDIFKRIAQNITNDINFIIPLFAKFGVLSPKNIFEIGKHLGKYQNEDSLKNITALLDVLFNEGILNIYRIKEDKNVYCIVPNVINSLQDKKSFKKNNWLLTMVSKPIIQAYSNITLDDIEKVNCLVEAFTVFMNWNNQSHSKANGKEIINGTNYEKNGLKVRFSFNGKKQTCYLICDTNSLNPGKDYVIVSPLGEDLPDLKEKCIENSKIYFLLVNELFVNEYGVWKTEKEIQSESLQKKENIVSIKEKDTISEVSKLDSEEFEKNQIELSSTIENCSSSDKTNDDTRQYLEKTVCLEVSEDMENEGQFSLPSVDNSNPDEENNGDSIELNLNETLDSYGITDETSAVDLAKIIIENQLGPEHYYVFKELIDRLISENRIRYDDDIVENSISQALVLAKSLSFCHKRYKDDFERLLLATDSSLQSHEYTGDNIIRLFENETSRTSDVAVLKLMTALRVMFISSSAGYDFHLFGYLKSWFSAYEANFENLLPLKSLYNIFLKINSISHRGFTPAVIQNLASDKNKNELQNKLLQKAKELVDEPRTQANNLLRAISPLPSRCFGLGSDMQECMKIIAENRIKDRDYVEIYLDDYCEKNNGQGYSISEQKIELKMDELWYKIESEIHTKIPTRAWHPKILEHYKKRLNIMINWCDVTHQTEEDKKIGNKLKHIKSEILAEINNILDNLNISIGSEYDRSIIENMLKLLKERLDGYCPDEGIEFADLLRTGLFCQDDKYIPFIDNYFSSCEFYEPWRHALNHIIQPVEGLRSVLDKITQTDYPFLYDNLGQSVLIQNYLNSKCGENNNAWQFFGDLQNSRNKAENDIARFKGDLEMAFAYGRISEDTKEELNENILNISEKFAKFYNYGCIRAFLDSQHKVIAKSRDERLHELKQDIEERKRNKPQSHLFCLLDKALEKMDAPESNFAVAEEYINRFDSGLVDYTYNADLNKENPFNKFINDDFEKIFDLCQKNERRNFKTFAADYLDRELKKKIFSQQYKNNAIELIRQMPNTPTETTPLQIQILLSQLGFVVAQSPKLINNSRLGNNIVQFSVELEPDAKDKSEYAHPIDIMGTKLHSPVNVFCFYGKLQPNNIVDKICSQELNYTAIVFLNGTMSLSGRRQMAERFHKEKSTRNPFILIDWVLLLHLAMYQQTERLPILLNCTLPFTSNYQPFVIRGTVSDEMFIGRKKELSSILDPNGPVFVYGGRQLGKTALLMRALSLGNHPDKKEFAVYINACAYSSEEKLVQAIIKELKTQNLQIGNYYTMSDFCENLNERYSKQEWKKILLLIDESDDILEAFRKQNPSNKAIIPLVELSKKSGSCFKFIFAGLHNVCRTANEPNTIFGQFGSPLCVKPISPAEGNELLTKPLSYLGFDINNSYLEHILVNTSFYPGIIHFVGYKLVENLANRYGAYYRAVDGNPPYTLEGKQLGEIMSGNALNEEINKRIRWTLDIDTRYFMLARCIAYLYYDDSDNNKTGHSLKTIKEYAQIFGIKCLENLENEVIENLLDELVEMGILVATKEGKYRMRQRRFLDAIGNSAKKIEEDIKNANER